MMIGLIGGKNSAGLSISAGLSLIIDNDMGFTEMGLREDKARAGLGKLFGGLILRGRADGRGPCGWSIKGGEEGGLELD